MKYLFIHLNFPGQFKFLAPSLVRQGYDVAALTLNSAIVSPWNGVTVIPYSVNKSSSIQIHPWIRDFETKVIRGEACFRAAMALKKKGYQPDFIIAHHGWGESMFLKQVWPDAKLSLYCEFFYRSENADVGFDPEFPVEDREGDFCRIHLKNLNNIMHFDFADAAISPTKWQASTFPESIQKKITVIHDGIDTKLISPNPNAAVRFEKLGVVSKTADIPIITFVNRNLEPYRGYHIFMRALPELLRQNKSALVLIVGGDDVSYGARSKDGRTWKEIFAQEVKGEISDQDWSRVLFLGRVDYPSFISILQLSSVHVYLTYPFVLSWSLLEAMSAGCAVVASDTAPVQEVISHDRQGLLLNFFDHQGLANTVTNLLRDKQKRESLGKAARAHVIANYDLQTVCLPKQLAWALGTSMVH